MLKTYQGLKEKLVWVKCGGGGCMVGGSSSWPIIPSFHPLVLTPLIADPEYNCSFFHFEHLLLIPAFEHKNKT